MRCWKCNKEFYSENLSQILCDECLAKIPKTTATTETTATTDFVNLLNTEMYELKISNLEAKLAEQQECSLKESAKHNLEMQNAQICVKELEAKLAESEKDRFMWQEMYKSADKQNKEICETDIYPLQEEITQLKQQLANYERIYTSLGFDNAKQFEDYVQFTMMNSDDKIKELRELQAKLAESEEEIKQLNNRILFSQLQAPKEQILNILSSQCIQYNPDQDKISFAVEQLKETMIYADNQGFMARYKSEGKAYASVWNYIYNQIKQLKGK